MSIKEFNREYSILTKGKSVFGQNEQIELRCLLARTLSNLHEEDLTEKSAEITVLLSNIYEIISKTEGNSAVVWTSVDILEKTIFANHGKKQVINQMRFLPILTEVLCLTTAHNKIEYVLKLIQDITFGIEIKTLEPFTEKLIRYIIQIVIDEKSEHENFRKTALSVLINLCCNNMASMSILSQEINLVDFQKKVSIDSYGILACKMNLVLNDCGHLLSDADVRNFLKFASKEVLKCMSSQEEKSLKQLIEFLKEVLSRQNIRHVLKDYDFHSPLEGAMMVLDGKDSNDFSLQINSLFEIINIILEAKNQSMQNLKLTILNFALKNLKNALCCVQSLQTLKRIFEYDSHINTKHFEFDDLQHTLMGILSNSDYPPHIMIPLLKLLIVLGINYKVNLITDTIIQSILSPLINAKNLKYHKLQSNKVTMYLQCLTTLSTLSDICTFNLKTRVLNEKNVQTIVGMSIKYGTVEQCLLALTLIKTNYFPSDSIAEMISDRPFDTNELNDSEITMLNNSNQSCTSNNIGLKRCEIGDDKFINLFTNIQKACNENNIQRLPTSDFIELYETQIFTLNQRIDAMTNKLIALSKEITLEKHNALRLEATTLKWKELSTTLQKSNEILAQDKHDLGKSLISTKTSMQGAENKIVEITAELLVEKKKNSELERKMKTLKESLSDLEKRQDVSVKTIFDLQNTLKEKASKIESLENELKETEDLRHTILTLMQTKRKK